MGRKRKLTEKVEDCLEAIYSLSKTKKVVRVKDIAKYLNTSLASVAVDLKTLAEKGLIIHEKYGYIELTREGEEVAKKIYERHQLLFEFFHEILGLPEDVANKDACRIEHYLSREGLERIVKFIEFIKSCPEGTPVWLTNFFYFLHHGKYPMSCIEKSKISPISLDQLPSGFGKIIKLGGKATFKHNLIRKGFIPGAIVEIKEKTDYGIKVKIGKDLYPLSFNEAKQIFVQEISP